MISGSCDDSGDDDGIVGGGVAAGVVNDISAFFNVVLTGKHWATLNATRYILIAENLKKINYTIFFCVHKNLKETFLFPYIKEF